MLEYNESRIREYHSDHPAPLISHCRQDSAGYDARMALARQVRHSHLPLKKIMPDSFELRAGRSQDDNSSSWPAVRTAAAAVHRVSVTVLGATVRVYGNLQPEFRRSLSHRETRLGDTGQPQRLLGDEEYAVPRNTREHQKIGQ